MSESTLLHAEDLHKSYRMGRGELKVLSGVSVEMRAGEVCALMGSSGSGKSTLLHLLGLLDSPDKGRIHIDGREVTHLGQAARAKLRARSVGFVFQQFHLLPELSALENTLMPRRLARGAWFGRRAKEKQRATDVLQAVGLGDRLRHRPSELSGGEQQRVAIARALVSEPALLLADEPTGNLDRSTGAEVLDLLLQLGRARGAAVLLATHDAEVAKHCDRVLQLVDGRLANAADSASAPDAATPTAPPAAEEVRP